ncbi:MAG: deoxyuridine 5'-triphosphate nucleotidohydrolase [Lachnospiraceae bacterium]|nr:deoxyuridine 5'-triphosphate nucleotidohydrolase [Lachnospiraceae bacterium]
MKIRVKMLADIEPPEAIEQGDWIDLRCADTTFIPEGGFEYIPLGVAMELPEGYEAIVAPRSSLFKRRGIIMTNSIGIMDESYCGDGDQWRIPAYATRDTLIPKGERICQFRIVRHQPEIKFEMVDTLGNPDRGGYGSTGAM